MRMARNQPVRVPVSATSKENKRVGLADLTSADLQGKKINHLLATLVLTEDLKSRESEEFSQRDCTGKLKGIYLKGKFPLML